MSVIYGLGLVLNVLVSVSNGNCMDGLSPVKSGGFMVKATSSEDVVIEGEYMCKDSESDALVSVMTELECPSDIGLTFDVEIVDYVRGDSDTGAADWGIVIGLTSEDFATNYRYYGYIMGTKEKAFKPSKAGYHRREKYGKGYQKGDIVTVLLQPNGNLIYFVNGISQGVAYFSAFNSFVGRKVAGVIRTAAQSSFKMSNLKCFVQQKDCLSGLSIASDTNVWSKFNSYSHVSLSGEYGCNNYASNAFQDMRTKVVCSEGQGIVFEVLIDDYIVSNSHSWGMVIGVTSQDFASTGRYYGYILGTKQKSYKAGPNGYHSRDIYGNGYKKGDLITVLLKANGELSFFVNGESQGIAYTNVIQSLGGNVVGIVRSFWESRVVSTGAVCV